MVQYAPHHPNERQGIQKIGKRATELLSMQVQIEFFGLSRLITGKKVQTIDFAEGATFRELVWQLGRIFPDLIGEVIQAGQDGLHPPNVFHTKDRHFVKQDQLDQDLKPDDHIVLMSFSAGG